MPWTWADRVGDCRRLSHALLGQHAGRGEAVDLAITDTDPSFALGEAAIASEAAQKGRQSSV